MKRISNSDWQTLLRLLPFLESADVPDLRMYNVVRRCRIILRKWRRNMKQ